MNTVLSSSHAPLGLGNPAPRSTTARSDAKATPPAYLATMLLAAALATLVVLVDRLIGGWADGHLLWAWLAMWAVVLGGTALLAGSARRLAIAILRDAASWGRALAEAHAELRQWNRIRHDPVLRAQWVRAQQAAAAEAEAGTQGWGRFPERLADGRTGHTHLNHL